MTGDIDGAIGELADADLLTRRQAEAFVYRDIEVVPREAAADAMGVSPSTLDKQLRSARDKVAAAESTLEAIQDLRHAETPTNCSECGATLGGAWVETDDGATVCRGCSDVDIAVF